MTDYRQKILAALASPRDYPPTTRELAEEIGTSFGNCRYHLEVLQEHGYITWEPRFSRTLTLTESGRRAVAAGWVGKNLETSS